MKDLDEVSQIIKGAIVKIYSTKVACNKADSLKQGKDIDPRQHKGVKKMKPSEYEVEWRTLGKTKGKSMVINDKAILHVFPRDDLMFSALLLNLANEIQTLHTAVSIVDTLPRDVFCPRICNYE